MDDIYAVQHVKCSTEATYLSFLQWEHYKKKPGHMFVVSWQAMLLDVSGLLVALGVGASKIGLWCCRRVCSATMATTFLSGARGNGFGDSVCAVLWNDMVRIGQSLVGM